MSGASDVVVVGAGIVGATAAYCLARARARVEVVDAGLAGQATAAATGMISPGTVMIRDPRIPPGFLALASRCGDFYAVLREWLAEDGELETGYAATGALFVARDETEAAELPTLARVLTERQAAGVPLIGKVEAMTAVDAQSLFPPLARDLAGALFVSGAARIEGRLLLAAVRRCATRRGASFRSGTFRGVDDDFVGGRALLLASGAWWSGGLASKDGVPPVTPMRGQVVHLQVDDIGTARWPSVRGFSDTSYMVAFSEGRVVVGATREASAGFDARVTAQGVDEVLTGALQIAPGLEQATFVEARVGLRPVTRDGSPMIGRLPGYDHVFVCCGHGPYGLLMGPGSAVATCALMLGQPPELDLEPFAPVRFMPTPPAPRVQPDTIDAALDSISAGGEI